MRRLACVCLLTLDVIHAQAAPPGVLTLRFLDVGQGDAVLITSPEGLSVLYDGGRSEARMKELIRQYDIRTVSLVVASHADSDHITGLIPVVTLGRPTSFLNSGRAGTTQTWAKLVAAVAAAGIRGLKATDQVIHLGSVTVTVLPPPPGMRAQNTNSVGLLVQYGTFRSLMTGDSETPETTAWLRRYPAATLGSIDVYKSIHHGAANGDTAAWLAAVRPKNVVVSVGPNNYGHPTATALELYRRVGAAVYRTDQVGTVTVTVRPGGAYRITTERSDASAASTATPTPQSIPATPPRGDGGVVYRNCAAVRAAGKSPLLRGQPGYRPGLDGDGDGRACE